MTLTDAILYITLFCVALITISVVAAASRFGTQHVFVTLLASEHASHTQRHTKGTCVCFARWNPSQINGGSEARRQLLNIYAQFLFHSLKQISNLGVSHGRAFLWFCSTTCGWCRALQRQLFFLCHNHLDPTFWAAARVPGIASSFSSSLPQRSRHC